MITLDGGVRGLGGLADVETVRPIGAVGTVETPFRTATPGAKFKMLISAMVKPQALAPNGTPKPEGRRKYLLVGGVVAALALAAGGYALSRKN